MPQILVTFMFRILFLALVSGHKLSFWQQILLPLNDMITIYKTLVQPHIDCCINVWGYAPKCQINRIQRLQNRIFRIITGDFNGDSSPSDMLNAISLQNNSRKIM